MLEFLCFDRQINVGPLLPTASAAPEDEKNDFILNGARWLDALTNGSLSWMKAIQFGFFISFLDFCMTLMDVQINNVLFEMDDAFEENDEAQVSPQNHNPSFENRSGNCQADANIEMEVLMPGNSMFTNHDGQTTLQRPNTSSSITVTTPDTTESRSEAHAKTKSQLISTSLMYSSGALISEGESSN